MPITFAQFLKLAKDILFPIFCLGCQKEGEWVCAACFRTLVLMGQYYCPVCHREQAGGACCRECAPISLLSAHLAMIRYNEEHLIGKILRTFKYQYAEDIFGVIEKMMAEFWRERLVLLADIDFIVPVPLHPRRFAERGFNQAAVIAQAVASAAQKLCADILARTRYTPHQALLPKQERRRNVDGAFAVRNHADVIGKSILLVDDIFTTGSTLQECAKALKTAGAESVSGFTVARG